MTAQAYAGAPGAMEPPEAQSIRSMLHIVRILAVIFGVLLFLGGLVYLGLVYATWSTCTSIAGNVCSALGFLLLTPLILVIFGVVDVVIYIQMKEIERLVNNRQYEAAKGKTLIWMILGFILGGLIIGILLLIAYLKFDPLITWQRNQGAAGTPMMAAPMGAAGGAPAGATGQKFCSSCGSPNAPGAGFCAKCGAALPP